MLDEPLVRLKCLVVDDEVLVAMGLADLLEDLGHTVVAIEYGLDRALNAARTEKLDLAFLDINLRGEMSFPVARVLNSRGVPVIFASGYGPKGLIAGFRGAHVLTKPYGVDEVTAMVAKATEDGQMH